MLIPPELASLLGNQCTIIVDNAKSPAFSATESAESLPALSPYRRSNKAKRATRQQPRPSKSNKKKTSVFLQTALVAPACRWTADLCHGSLHQHYQQQPHHELTNESPRKSSSQFVNDRLTSTLLLSPQQRRPSQSRRPSLTSSPKMPSRQASFRNAKTPTSSSSPLRCSTPSSSGGTDSCPRQPQRRSCIPTAEILQEALNSIRICDLSSDNNDDKNNDDTLSPSANSSTSTTVSPSPPPSNINVVAPSSRQ